MEKSEHVYLSSQGADEFSKLNGCEIVDPSYFVVESRQNQLR